MRQSSLPYATTVLAFSAVAMNTPAIAAESNVTPLTSVEIVLVGQLANEPTLFGRVKSLFDPSMLMKFETAVQLDPNAVLKPELPGKLYVWITQRASGSARVYVAIREPVAENARYLYRDVALESGLDEVGIETLAQIAHSSARALWAHEQQVSRSAVEKALQSELAVKPSQVTPPEENRSGPPAMPPVTPSLVNDGSHPAPTSPTRTIRVGLAARYAVRVAGGEGWIHEPGGSLSVVFNEQFSVGLGVAYVVPHRFDAPLTRIKLEGFSSEARVGWKTRPIAGFRGHLEAGIGVFFAHWTAESHAPAAQQPGQYEQRPFALSSLGFERELGPLTFGVRAQLKIPFRATRYEVIGSEAYSWKTDAWLSPGLALDISGPLD